MIGMDQKKLHVLQVSGTMNRGGAEVMVIDIYRNISPTVKFDFLINVKKDDLRPKGDFDDEILRRGGRLLYIGTQWDLGIARYILEFKKIIQEIGKPDVVHIHMNAKCGMIALAARMCGIKKIITHAHAALKFKGPFLKRFPSIVELKLQKVFIALFATDFWGCSKDANASLYYRRLIDQQRTVVINNAVDTAAFQNVPADKIKELLRSYRVQDGVLILGNVGRVVRHKKVDFVMDVLKVLNDRKVDFLFVFAGREDDKDYMCEIMDRARRHQVADRIRYLSDRDDIPVVMSTFDVFVGPAINEGFGLVAAEAQAAGVPCVLSTGFPPAVDMKLNLVTYLDDYQPVLWANAILKVRDDKCSDRALIQTRIAELGFDAATNTRIVEQLYRS